MFALVDCNNFYVSCERIFQPRLEGRPVVVLSNNDGCIVSRSEEAKELGIKMGTPYFKAKPLLDAHDARVFSSNYALYGDISRRVMSYLAEVAPEVEVYSIDEAFLDLTGMEQWLEHNRSSLTEYGRRLKQEIKQWIHVPICMGIAPTKTLAKLANRIAKKDPMHHGVLHLDSDARCRWALEQVGVEDVWGIGRQYAPMLQQHGIATAADLARVSDVWARRHLGGVVGLRIVRELQGVPCLEMIPPDGGAQPRHSVAYTRTFGQPLAAYPDILSAVATFTTRVAEKLRRQGCAANMLTVFISKSRYGPAPPPYTYSNTLSLPVATRDTAELLRYARVALKQLWQPGTSYKKAGVILTGLEPGGLAQLNLFVDSPHAEQRAQLMAELDKLNTRYGAGTVGFAVELADKNGCKGAWAGKKEMRTPAYTTSLPEVWRINIDGLLLG
ncbi:Y-family DNA polymerase [Hymenobacter chitinivorans]|uniref:DNA polymerase V n=1 Tax=Hymenobacter chitinivorans DSM 11115 TaxID=1121954 RepID=A0A2M9ARR1_9BACT|nr:Y-family DNA polymerase [Hymenobacter chitinivorans]PJJ48394.1 DNA polymerase V [Hymenobacter chitinivorans DSM 11115]